MANPNDTYTLVAVDLDGNEVYRTNGTLDQVRVAPSDDLDNRVPTWANAQVIGPDGAVVDNRANEAAQHRADKSLDVKSSENSVKEEDSNRPADQPKVDEPKVGEKPAAKKS